MPSNTLFIFAKPNRMGQAKTRLARDIGRVEAQRLNAMATSRVLRNAKSPRWHTVLMVAPDLAVWSRQPAWPNSIDRLPQGSGNLGDRMTRAFDAAPLGKVIFLGTDQPDLKKIDLLETLKTLQTHHAVFGPADDGGFWLFGMRKGISTSAPFQNVRWSTEHALADVRANLHGQSIAYLEQRIDLDDAKAVKNWRSRTKA